MKKKLGIAIMALGIALTGCTTPPAWELSGSPKPYSPPSERTPAPTTTPEWTDEEQAAIDAVLTYREEWSNISQNLLDHDADGSYVVDLNDIYDVASDPLAQSDLMEWADWRIDSMHLVGKPTLAITNVDTGMLNNEGQRYYVDACSILDGAYTVKEDGSRIDGLAERVFTTWEVLIPVDGTAKAFNLTYKDRSC
jgi:hypothetical protein